MIIKNYAGKLTELPLEEVEPRNLKDSVYLNLEEVATVFKETLESSLKTYVDRNRERSDYFVDDDDIPF